MATIATMLPEDLQDYIAKNAGVLASSFDTSTWTISRTNIIGATSGGIQFKDAPSYSDWGDDIDNCPKDMMELKQLDSREVTVAGTYVSVKPSEIKNLVGAADLESETGYELITPRDELKTSDFISTLWFITDYGDGNAIAIKLENVLNSDGYSLSTTDKGKGQHGFTYRAHYSMSDPDKVPYEIYIKK